MGVESMIVGSAMVAAAIVDVWKECGGGTRKVLLELFRGRRCLTRRVRKVVPAIKLSCWSVHTSSVLVNAHAQVSHVKPDRV